MTRWIGDALRELAKSLDPPPPLQQPDPTDLHRYRVLLAERGITVDSCTLTAGLDRPELLRVPAFDQPSAARPGTRGVRELTAHTYEQDTARALGPRLAATITRAPGWPALQVVLRRAETAGHNPQTLLGLAAIRTGLDPAAALAHRLSAHLHDHPTPAVTGLDANTPTGRTWAWPHLAWTLKAAETTGVDLADLLPAPDKDGPDHVTSPPSRPGSAQAWLHAQTAARRNQWAHPRAAAAEAVTSNEADNPHRALPWAPAPVSGTVTDTDSAYLDQLQHLIAARVTALRDQLAQAVTDRTQPAWTNAAGPAPDMDGQRQAWLDAVAVVAAFRDQHPLAVDDPAQPLGPHPEPAPHADRAHAAAHAEAALALTRAWDLAHPNPASGNGPALAATRSRREGEVLRQVTTAAWTSLTTNQKHAVAARVLARLGTLPNPDHQPLPGQQPDPAEPVESKGWAARPGHDPHPVVLSGLGQAITHPRAIGQLHRALVEAGHLPDQPDDTQTQDGPGVRRNRVQRVRADQLRRTPIRRSDIRQAPQRTQNQPQPAPRPDHDYSPQPGRLDPNHGYRHRLMP
jgi:hypothetical protein